jgi:hypothetical protein
MLMPTRIAPMPLGVTVHAPLLGVGVLGVPGGDAVSGAGGVVDADRSVSDEEPGCVFSTVQAAVAATRSMTIDPVRTGRSLEVESASGTRFPCPVNETGINAIKGSEPLKSAFQGL